MKFDVQKNLPVLALVSCAALALCGPAHAEEGGIVPYFAGVEIGVPTGAAPPPGVYLSDTMYTRQEPLYNGAGNRVPIKINLYGNSLSAVWVPGWQVLGGTYLAFIKQPISNNVVSAFGHHSNGFGMFNTIISPFNLSWMVAPGLFVAGGTTFYLKDATYARNAAVEMGNNYYTFEPSVSVSYLGGGLNLTALANYDINSENTNSPNAANGHYQSGQVLTIDLTATKRFGAWSAGLGGYVVQQTTNDTANGAVVPATPYESRGDKIGQIALGPVLGYQFGRYSLTAYDTYDVRHVNTAGGNMVWLRLSGAF
jgi:hypothetical protein